MKEEYRKHGVGKQMVETALAALREEKVCKVNLIAFQTNQVGNRFWQSLGWSFRSDVNYYEYNLNEENVTTFQ